MKTIGSTFDLTDNIKYFFSDQHRSTSRSQKSKWLINIYKELKCFELAHESSWLSTTTGWGVHIVDNYGVDWLGKNRFGKKLKIAKFVDKNKCGTWHGYPADYERNNQDIPSICILADWRDKGIIDKSSMSRISRGLGGGF